MIKNYLEIAWRSSGVFDWAEKDPERRVDLVFTGVDYDFFETLNLEIKEGRAFSKEVPSDERGGYILNESAIKEIGIRKALGASAGKIIVLLTKEFTKWVLIANLFA